MFTPKLQQLTLIRSMADHESANLKPEETQLKGMSQKLDPGQIQTLIFLRAVLSFLNSIGAIDKEWAKKNI